MFLSNSAIKMNASPSLVRKGAGSNVNSVSPNVTHKGTLEGKVIVIAW